MDDFLTALRTLITDCDFRNQSDRNLMLQLIEGCRDRKVQLELLAMRDLTLEGTLAIMRAHETALRECSAMGQDRSSGSSHQQVQRLAPPRKGRKPAYGPPAKTCQRCGGSHNRTQCPAKDRECNHCHI